MRILMRGAINPLYPMEPSKFIIENHTGGNICNMLFTHSIAKSLLVDDNTTIDFVNISKEDMDRYYADYVNDNYDYFAIPLANAFKVRGHEEMVKIADFIKMLKIPVGIIGISLQSRLDNDKFIDIYTYCDEAKYFVSAVLDKSAMIGVWGEHTAEFLSDLGFKAEKDFTVIGCPSMYTFGDRLPDTKKLTLSESSRVAFNSKVEFDKIEEYAPFVSFAKRNMELFPDYRYIQQQIDDVRMIYLDNYMNERREGKYYDIAKARSFVDVPSWLRYLNEKVDLSVGSRIHGNIAAVLSGVPAITVPFDLRVKELSDYHNIPQIEFSELSEDLSLYDVINKVDFSAVHNGHKERFNHYLDYLHKIGLTTIYDKKYENGVTPYDKIIRENEYNGTVIPFELTDRDEQFKRYREAFPIAKNLDVQDRKVIKKLREDRDNLRAELEEAMQNASRSYKRRKAKEEKAARK